MPTNTKNKSGDHTHPQKDHQSQDGKADLAKSSTSSNPGKGKKGQEPKESFGKSGAKDSH